MKKERKSIIDLIMECKSIDEELKLREREIDAIPKDDPEHDEKMWAIVRRVWPA